MSNEYCYKSWAGVPLVVFNLIFLMIPSWFYGQSAKEWENKGLIALQNDSSAQATVHLRKAAERYANAREWYPLIRTKLALEKA